MSEQFLFLITHFFTHKDFLPDPALIPGTLFTPLQLVLEAVFLAAVLAAAFHTAATPERIRPIFRTIFFTLLIYEGVIDLWDSLAGISHRFDPAVSLPLYPCSIFLYALPFVIWGRGILRQSAEGYICTLGLVGAVINFLYPASRLTDYSCISFPAFHTFLYHGCMLYAAMVLLLSGEHRFDRIHAWWEPFLASIPGLILSVPANVLNYSAIQSDYMYFTGQHALAQMIFREQTGILTITAVMYLVYLVGPALFYLVPWMVRRRVPKTVILQKYQNRRDHRRSPCSGCGSSINADGDLHC